MRRHKELIHGIEFILGHLIQGLYWVGQTNDRIVEDAWLELGGADDFKVNLEETVGWWYLLHKEGVFTPIKQSGVL